MTEKKPKTKTAAETLKELIAEIPKEADTLAEIIKEHYPKLICIRELKFKEDRKWQIDLSVFSKNETCDWYDLTNEEMEEPRVKLAIEIEGGAWQYGRHNHAAGFLKDMEKYNAITIAGFNLLRFTPQQVNNGEAFETIQEFLNVKEYKITDHKDDVPSEA